MTNKISYKSNSKIIKIDDEQYVIKRHNIFSEEIYKYLKTKEFTNYLEPAFIKDNYEYSRYIPADELPKEDKAIELIQVMTMLHTKTTTYQEINIDEIKKLYEETKNYISYLRNYYLDLQDYIETKEFFSPAEQVLMFNISSIYKSLNFAEQKLDDWYNLKSTQKRERQVQLHNNLSLEHFLISEDKYLINWKLSSKNYVVYDFIKLFQNEFDSLEMTSLFDIYQTKYKYTEDEQFLFQAFLSIPPKLTFNKTNYINTINARKTINYVSKVFNFISKYNEEDK